MYRATTPMHTFTIPFPTNVIDKLLITYNQKGIIILEKTESDVIFDNENKIKVVLTQDETNLFDPENMKIQLRIKTKTGDVIASDILTVRVKQVLSDTVL